MASNRQDIFFNQEPADNDIPPLPPIDNLPTDVVDEIFTLWDLDCSQQPQRSSEDDIESFLPILHVSRNSSTSAISSLANLATSIQCVLQKLRLQEYMCKKHFEETNKKFHEIGQNLSKLAAENFSKIFGDFCEPVSVNFTEETIKPEHVKNQLTLLWRQFFAAKEALACERLNSVIDDCESLGYEF